MAKSFALTIEEKSKLPSHTHERSCRVSRRVNVLFHWVDWSLTTGSASIATFRCSKPVFLQVYNAAGFLFLGETFASSSDNNQEGGYDWDVAVEVVAWS